MSDMSFASKLACWKQKNGYKTAALAKRIGVSESTVYCWLHGRSEPELFNLRRLVEATGIDANYWAGVR